MEKYIIFAFDSTHAAILSEKVLKENNLNGRLIPLPPEVSAGCGLSLRIDEKDRDIVSEKLSENNVGIDGVFELIKEGTKRSIKKAD